MLKFHLTRILRLITPKVDLRVFFVIMLKFHLTRMWEDPEIDDKSILKLLNIEAGLRHQALELEEV
jgi:hypothetical protein